MNDQERIEQDLREKLTEPVFMAVGEASACWENLSGAGIFDSDHAKIVAERLLDHIIATATEAVTR